jgi:trans-aconitate methyltransferase
VVATQWNATDYAKNSQGQFAWALNVIERLSLGADDHVLDLGCGDGKVSVELARRVPAGRVVGVDSSPGMIDLARSTWCPTVPNVEFRVADARSLNLSEAFDVAFSNSALHWIPDHLTVLRGVAAALKRGGNLFFSMGGRGSAAVVYSAIDELMRLEPWASLLSGARPPHHFFGPEDYDVWLPQAGLRPRRVELVQKPMHHANVQALEGWLRTTWMPYAERMAAAQRAEFVAKLAERVRLRCHTADTGAILLPMVNLEVEAEKLG